MATRVLLVCLRWMTALQAAMQGHLAAFAAADGVDVVREIAQRLVRAVGATHQGSIACYPHANPAASRS